MAYPSAVQQPLALAASTLTPFEMKHELTLHINEKLDMHKECMDHLILHCGSLPIYAWG